MSVRLVFCVWLSVVCVVVCGCVCLFVLCYVRWFELSRFDLRCLVLNCGVFALCVCVCGCSCVCAGWL